MPYLKKNFTLDRGNIQTDSDLNKASIHTYIDLTETFANMTASSYFPDYFGFDANEVTTGDLVYIEASDNLGCFRLPSPININLSASVNNLTVNQYGMSTITFSMSGWASSLNIEIPYTINNDVVTLNFPQISSTASQYNTVTATFPQALFPVANINKSLILLNGNFPSNGYFTLTTAGSFSAIPYLGGGTVSASYGFLPFSVSYIGTQLGA